MELDEPLLYEDDETLARTLLGDADFERLWRDGWTRLDYPTPFVPFTDGFPTPSGKLEFFSERAAADGHDPLPGYVPPALTGDAPLSLIAPASHWFLNSMFANKPDLMKRAGEPRIELHARRRDRARDRDRRRGARVQRPRRRSSPIAEISDRVSPGVIASTKGHWLKNVRGGANVNATVEERDADMGGGAIFHDNRVEVEGVASGRSGERAAGALARRSARPDRSQPAAALPAHQDGLARTQ